MDELTTLGDELRNDDVLRMLCHMLEAHAVVEAHDLEGPVAMAAARAYHHAAEAVLLMTGVDPRPTS